MLRVTWKTAPASALTISASVIWPSWPRSAPGMTLPKTWPVRIGTSRPAGRRRAPSGRWSRGRARRPRSAARSRSRGAERPLRQGRIEHVGLAAQALGDGGVDRGPRPLDGIDHLVAAGRGGQQGDRPALLLLARRGGGRPPGARCRAATSRRAGSPGGSARARRRRSRRGGPPARPRRQLLRASGRRCPGAPTRRQAASSGSAPSSASEPGAGGGSASTEARRARRSQGCTVELGLAAQAALALVALRQLQADQAQEQAVEALEAGGEPSAGAADPVSAFSSRAAVARHSMSMPGGSSASAGGRRLVGRTRRGGDPGALRHRQESADPQLGAAEPEHAVPAGRGGGGPHPDHAALRRPAWPSGTGRRRPGAARRRAWGRRAAAARPAGRRSSRRWPRRGPRCPAGSGGAREVEPPQAGARLPTASRPRPAARRRRRRAAARGRRWRGGSGAAPARHGEDLDLARLDPPERPGRGRAERCRRCRVPPARLAGASGACGAAGSRRGVGQGLAHSALISRAYGPSTSFSSSWVPRWTTLPRSRTMISSASRMVLRRWATIRQVQPRRRRLSSISSRWSGRGRWSPRRAPGGPGSRPARGRSPGAGAGRRSSWRRPPRPGCRSRRGGPRRPRGCRRPCAAATTSGSGTVASHSVRFSRTVPSNRKMFWSTRPSELVSTSRGISSRAAAVEQDLAAPRLVEAGDQLGDGRLAAARAADQGDARPRAPGSG